MSGSTVAVVGALIDAHRVLVPLLDEHLADNERQVLPHLLVSDIVRWLVEHRESHPDVCSSVLGWLGSAYERGPDDVRELIAVSVVEMLPDPGQSGGELHRLLGPLLRRLDPWSRP